MVTAPRRRALIVDDDAEVRAILAEYLTGCGFEALLASNGLEALLEVKRQRPEVVVIDVQMPRLGGLDALKHIRAFDPTTRVIVVSGRAHEIREQALALGAHAVLGKPLDFPDLSRALGASHESAAAARMLIVDDDDGIRMMLQEFALANGYRARSVADAATALRTLVAEPCDIVLLDIDMPGLSGVDALPALRAVAPGVAVIMVSGTESQAVAQRALAGGAFDYVVKPVDLTRLREVVEAALLLKGQQSAD